MNKQEIRKHMIDGLQRNYGLYYINAGTPDRRDKIDEAFKLHTAGVVNLEQNGKPLTDVNDLKWAAVTVIAVPDFDRKLAEWESKEKVFTDVERKAISSLIQHLGILYDRAIRIVNTYSEETQNHDVELDALLADHGQEIGSLFPSSIDEWAAGISTKIEELKELIGEKEEVRP